MLYPLVPLIFYAWVLVIVVLFSQLPPTKALLIAVIGGILFLPWPQFIGPASFLITKVTMTSLGCLLGTILFHSERISSFTPNLLDLPAFILSIWVIPSQISNGLSALSPVAYHILVWGVPYFLGRIYLNNLQELKQLSIGILISGLMYAPFCLWEGRMSPQLGNQIYGYGISNGDFRQTIRLGGFRPAVFLGHGLPVGLWMAAATIIVIWFWQFKVFKKFWNQPILLLVIGMVITFILVRSTGAYVYVAACLGIMVAAKWFRTTLPLLLLIAWLLIYILLGATGIMHQIPSVQTNMDIAFSPNSTEILGERGQSYWYRVGNEEILSAHSRKKLWTGWGGSGGNFVPNPRLGGKLTVPDSFWIIQYSVLGAPGLFGFVGMMVFPSLAFLFRYPARLWKHPKLAPVAVLSVVNIVYFWDSTLNTSPLIAFVVSAGGLVGLVSKAPEKLTLEQPKLKTQVQTLRNTLPPATMATKKRKLAVKRAVGMR